ncbi:MAG: hypothetical protein HYT30_01165 [Parcubacteria group bacterium]|nr:hypothetical protein [Parcubacteria group bacterium]
MKTFGFIAALLLGLGTAQASAEESTFANLTAGDRVLIGDWMPKQINEEELNALWTEPAELPTANTEDEEKSSLDRFEFCGEVCRTAFAGEENSAAKKFRFTPASAL